MLYKGEKMKKRYDAYANYYYKYSNKKKTKTKVLSILFCLITILIVVFFSISFSKFLTISKIVNVNSNYINESKSLYALSLYSSTNKTDANNYSTDVKKQGGAGFVYYKDSTFFILSSIYKTNSEATTVKNNLAKNNIDSEIIKIELPTLNIKASLTTKSGKILSEGITLFYNSYSSLYKISLNYDTQNIDIIQAKHQIASLLDENTKVITNFNKYFNQSTNVYVLYIKIYLNKLNNVVTQLTTIDESENFSSRIKETYCEVVNEYLNLYGEML